MQGPKETFADFSLRLTSVVNRVVSYSELGEIIIIF